jgi:O-antigen/teichoic acid export membrane protein
MAKVPTLFRQTAHYVGGRATVLLLGLLSFPLYTRLFSVAEYGRLSLILKLVTLATTAAKLGLQHAVVRYYEENQESDEQRTAYYSTLFAGAVLASCAVSLLAFGVLTVSWNWFEPDLRTSLLVGCVLVAIRGLYTLELSFLRVEGRTGLYNVVEVLIRAGAVTVVPLLLLLFGVRVWVFLTGLIVVEAIVTLSIFVSISRRTSMELTALNRELLRSSLVYCIPLLGGEASTILLDSGDRIFVTYFLGATQLGYYSVVYNFSAYIQDLLLSPLGLAMAPAYMKIWVRDGPAATEAFLRRGLNGYILAAAGVLAAATVSSREMLIVLSSRKYESGFPLLPVILAGLLFWGTQVFFNAPFLIHRKTVELTRLVFFSFLVNAALNICLLRTMGIWGAAIATLLSYAFNMGMMAWQGRKHLAVGISWVQLGKATLAAAAATALVFRIQTGLGLFVNGAVKGLSAIILYVAFLCAIDVEARGTVGKVVGYLNSSVRVRALDTSD